MSKKRKKELENVLCPYCQYSNSKENYMGFGTCTRCGKTLNEKYKFMHEIKSRLRIGGYKRI